MESHHALGRRMLEEIRQKRAASRGSSLSDVHLPSPHGIPKSDSGSGLSEIKDVEKQNAKLLEENNHLLLLVKEKEKENDTLKKQMFDLEQTSLPSLRKALMDIQTEKDAAVVAREDLLTQLRALKKRLKEAEEEQYQAEEDATALRAEIKVLQEQVAGQSRIGFNSVNQFDQMQMMEKEISDLKSMLLQESALKEQEQQRLREEQLRSSLLASEKKELEARLLLLNKASEEAIQEASRGEGIVQEKKKVEMQLHDMALMVERLESSRQKLLAEVDTQSSEIERLFKENSDLSVSYQDALRMTVEWEEQVEYCLKQNEELRVLLGELRIEQANILVPAAGVANNDAGNDLNVSDFALLKKNLANEQARSEALSAEVLKLSAQFKCAVNMYNHLSHMYQPVLRNIESGLTKIK